MIEGYRCCEACKYNDECNRSLLECRRYQSIEEEKAKEREIGLWMYPLTVVCLALVFLAYLFFILVAPGFDPFAFLAWLIATMFLVFFILPDERKRDD